ncbi:MAG TPA: hypothetical protein EYP35_04460 [Desulfobacterales bacterium]|nr:hypothetical protein [Desulfobacterales bacterium]HIP37938.1 hypothetical protein [Desulfocapsa sulfexigens]
MKHYSIHTERTYCDWIKRFILFHNMQDCAELYIDSEKKIEKYLSHIIGIIFPLTHHR